MTEEMYKRLNDYLNDIFLELNKTDKIFTDNLINFTIINNMVANKFLNWIGVTANGLGNHELDVVPSKLAELMKSANFSNIAQKIYSITTPKIFSLL